MINIITDDEEGLLTEREIAVILGISRGRVWEIKRNALRKLRKAFLDDPIIREYILSECDPNAGNT